MRRERRIQVSGPREWSGSVRKRNNARKGREGKAGLGSEAVSWPMPWHDDHDHAIQGLDLCFVPPDLSQDELRNGLTMQSGVRTHDDDPGSASEIAFVREVLVLGNEDAG